MQPKDLGLPEGTKCVVLHAAHPAEALIAYAGDHQIGLIAMATHSRRGISHFVWGSSTEAVIRSGVAPVLVVRPHE